MTNVWHSRLRHMSSKYMDMLSQKEVLSKIGKNDLDFCEHCVMGRQKPFGVGTHSSNEFLEYIYSDVWGHSLTASLSGKWYYVSFIHDYSKFIWVYFLTEKNEVFETFNNWRARVETQSGKKVKALNVRVGYLRSDNGGEYTFKKFGRYCKEEGIMPHLTRVYIPQQNAIAEQVNQMVLEKVWSILSQSGLPHEFWAEVVNIAVYLVNLSPSSATNFLTPFEMRHKRMADYSRLRVFGCNAYPLTPTKNRSKLEPTSKKCRFLGYATNVKDYRVWNSMTSKIIVSRDVYFNVQRTLKDEKNAQTSTTNMGKSPTPITIEGEIGHYISNDML
jgi:transposase InsO family protein